jgi:SepF-like predicted cell division protein (DUF552 family)
MNMAKGWLDRVFRGEAVSDAAYGAQEAKQEEDSLQSGLMDGTYARRAAQSAPRKDNLVEFSRARAGASAETGAGFGTATKEPKLGASGGFGKDSAAPGAGSAYRDTGGFTREFKDGGGSGGGGFGGGGFGQKSAAETAEAYVVFKRLKDFTMASHVADRMTESKIVILNLESCDDEIARRVLDFIGGVAYACGSMVKRIAGRVFMITPKGVNADGEFFDEARETTAAIRYDD